MVAVAFVQKWGFQEGVPLVLPCFQNGLQQAVKNASSTFTPAQKTALEGALDLQKHFPKSGIFPVIVGKKKAPIYLFFLGDEKSFGRREAREAGEKLSALLQNFAVEEVAIVAGILNPKFWRVFQEGTVLGAYEFTVYKTNGNEQDQKKSRKLQKISFVGVKDAELQRRLPILEEALRLARDLINEPPMVATPAYVVKTAQKIAQRFRSAVSIKVFEEKELQKLGCGGILAVGQGSMEDSRLIILEYKGGKKEAPLALVGKGVTFDTGGLDIKVRAMRTMKQDLAGAATVLGSFFALVALGVKKNLLAVVPTVENAVGSKAYRPDDILRMYNGKTVEVTNTDAEGRLILADALSYTEKNYKPRAMIDLATLTGACTYAVGDDFTAILGNNAPLITAIKKAAAQVDEPVWELPLHQRYKFYVDSKVADIVNSSRKLKAGTIEGALFLQHFVTDKTPWCHFDIASVAFDDGTEMASGRNVRLLIELAENY
jgi:leucyl aminopeptidase